MVLTRDNLRKIYPTSPKKMNFTFASIIYPPSIALKCYKLDLHSIRRGSRHAKRGDGTKPGYELKFELLEKMNECIYCFYMCHIIPNACARPITKRQISMLHACSWVWNSVHSFWDKFVWFVPNVLIEVW
mmetsp:Transcript_2281/g.2358  ORF Transcript_2281/g.2358 Transcript_2281/m.2358 type:complete len:130 (-) Transcript_2281:487-876(-)